MNSYLYKLSKATRAILVSLFLNAEDTLLESSASYEEKTLFVKHRADK